MDSGIALHVALADALFGDVPLDDWCEVGNPDDEPWRSFAAARQWLAKAREGDAVGEMRRLVSTPGFGSRHYLQAWTVLRDHGVEPPASEAKHVYGAVVEVPVAGGHDVLAAYEDYTAMYLNYSGAVVDWRGADRRVNAAIDDLLDAANTVANLIGPWMQPRRPPPPKQVARFSMLTPSGIHFGEGDFDRLLLDPMGEALFTAATPLMRLLVGSQLG